MSKTGCINRHFIPVNYLQDWVALRITKEKVDFDFSNIEFKEKELIETNQNYKQPIPYILLLNKNKQLAIYQRNSSEKHLNKLWSIGLGVNIEPWTWLLAKVSFQL